MNVVRSWDQLLTWQCMKAWGSQVTHSPVKQERKAHHSTPLEMVLKVNNKLRNIYSRKSTKIQLKKPKVWGIWSKTSSGRQRLHSRLLQPGTVDSLSPSQWPFNVSHPAPNYLLPRPGPGQVQWMLRAPFSHLTPICVLEALPWNVAYNTEAPRTRTDKPRETQVAVCSTPTKMLTAQGWLRTYPKLCFLEGGNKSPH